MNLTDDKMKAESNCRRNDVIVEANDTQTAIAGASKTQAGVSGENVTPTNAFPEVCNTQGDADGLRRRVESGVLNRQDRGVRKVGERCVKGCRRVRLVGPDQRKEKGTANRQRTVRFAQGVKPC